MHIREFAAADLAELPVPGAFAHPTLGRVGLHIMYCAFETDRDLEER